MRLRRTSKYFRKSCIVCDNKSRERTAYVANEKHLSHMVTPWPPSSRLSLLPGVLGDTMAHLAKRTRGLLKKAKSARELLDLVGVDPESVKQRAKAAVQTGFAALAKATDALEQDQRYRVRM